MNAAGADLLAGLRAELAAIEPARRCCRAAERAGLGAAAEGRARTPLLGRLAVRLEESAGGRGPDGGAGFDWDAAAEHCRSAYLRGAFLARGSLSAGSGGTHLELVVDAGETDAFAARLAAAGLPPGKRLRRGRGVLTWKSAEQITELLRRMGASASTLELESQLVSRQMTGYLNRVVNAENANLRRAVAAARRQLDDIDALERTGSLARLPREARRVAAARRRAPEATLAELAEQLDMSRSRVQRAFDQLGSAALQHEQEATVPGTTTAWT